MKTAVVIFCLVLLGLVLCWGIGLVEFTYPKVVPNEPLSRPQKVSKLEGTNMTLETGTMLALSPLQTSERGIEKIFLDISNQVARSGFEVDLESKGDDRVEIFVRRPRKFCDSVPPFTIPIIPQTVGRMHKAAVAFGVYLSTNSQPTGAANAATPHR